MEMKLFNTLKLAYDRSTHSFNSFENAIEKINWDKTFRADGEIYFVKGRFTLTVENIDPFQEMWKPTVYFSDGSIIQF